MIPRGIYCKTSIKNQINSHKLGVVRGWPAYQGLEVQETRLEQWTVGQNVVIE